MPYRIPEPSCPGLSRDTTFTLQTSSYQHVHCSITSDPFFITALCFYHGKNCQQKHKKGGKFKNVPLTLLRLGGFPAIHLKICYYYTSSDLKILLLFWSGAASCKKCLWRDWSQRGVMYWWSQQWEWSLVTALDLECQEFGTPFT